jgi:hypothetical protein
MTHSGALKKKLQLRLSFVFLKIAKLKVNHKGKGVLRIHVRRLYSIMYG